MNKLFAFLTSSKTLDEAKNKLNAISAMCKNAGFEGEPENENALAEFIALREEASQVNLLKGAGIALEDGKSAADVLGSYVEGAKAVASKTAGFEKSLNDTKAELKTANTRIGNLNTALSGVGIEITAEADAEAITNAISEKVKSKAHKQSLQTVASAGHEPVSLNNSDEGDDSDADDPKNAKEFLDAYEALENSNPAEANAYWKKHAHKFKQR